MSRTSLIYVADPMCSWCYGFAPSLAALQARWPHVPVQVLLGGLRPYGVALDPPFKAELEHHWQEVEQHSGQPFDRSSLERPNWVYTTEPACRAVVTVRELDPSKALEMLHAVQRAFYAEGRDTTDAATLADVAAGIGFDRSAFEAAFTSTGIVDTTHGDFATTQRLGVRGFPTLVALDDTRGELVCAGWLAPAALIAHAARLLR